MTPRPQEFPVDRLPPPTLEEESSLSSSNTEGTGGIEMKIVNLHDTKASSVDAYEEYSESLEFTTGDSQVRSLPKTFLVLEDLPKERSGCEVIQKDPGVFYEKAHITREVHCGSDDQKTQATTTLEVPPVSVRQCSITDATPLESRSVPTFEKPQELKKSGDIGFGHHMPFSNERTNPSETPTKSVQARETIQVPLIDRKDCNGPWKTVLVIGESASDNKSMTVINMMVNFLMGVKYDDPFRYVVVSECYETAELQPTKSTQFNFYPTNRDIPYGVSILNIPVGYGRQVANMQHDTEMWQKAEKACFVVHPGDSGLTRCQQHLFKKVSHLLDKEKIVVMVLGSTGKKTLSTSSIRRVAGTCPKRFLFLHDTLTICKAAGRMQGNETETSVNDTVDRDESFWEHNFDALKRLFTKDWCIVPEKPCKKKKYLSSDNGSETLNNVVVSINNQIRTGLDTLVCIRQTICCLIQHQKDLDDNADFKINLPNPTLRKIAFSREGAFTATCLVCNSSSTSSSIKYVEPDITGSCQACQGRHVWSTQSRKSYMVKHFTEWLERAMLQEEEVVEAAASGMSHTEFMLRKQRAIYVATKSQILRDIEIVRRSIGHLNCKDHRYKFLDHDHYFQLLINSEMKRGENGFWGRVQSIQTLREHAQRSSEATDTESSSDESDDKDGFLIQLDSEIERAAQNHCKKPGRTALAAIPRLFGRSSWRHK